MHSKHLRYLMSRPEAMIHHGMTRQLPRMLYPSSPLITLLESMTYHERLRWQGVRLSPQLGYQCGHPFHNAQQLLTWLKPDHQMLECEHWPAESFRIKRLSQKLTVDDLKPFSTQLPD